MTTARRVPRERAVISLTADDDRFAAARAHALELARADGNDLILYDWDAATLIGDPLPTVWSADTDDADRDRLDEAALEAAGRHELARQVRAANASGVPATGWLPSTHDPADLLAYARDRGAVAIVVPKELVDDGLTEDLAKATESSEAGGAPRIIAI